MGGKVVGMAKKIPGVRWLGWKAINFAKRSKNPFISQIYSKAHQKYRVVKYGGYNFVSLTQAAHWTANWIQHFDRQYDVIIGVPRSGLYIANIIALKLGKPLTTPELFAKNKFWLSKSVKEPKNIQRVLIVDDSINSGWAMRNALKDLKKTLGEKKYAKYEFRTAALIARETAADKVDMFYKILPEPTLFEWNIMHSNGVQSKKLGIDLDGVLCPNFRGDDMDEARYLDWLTRAPAYLVPAFEIDVIISNRLEQYRGITEAWLKHRNIKYKKLVLWNLPDKSLRGHDYAKQKTKMILREKCDIFYESAEWEAKYIFKKTGIPVLCIDTMRMYS